MDGVPAGQHGCRLHALKQVLEADGAVLVHGSFHADVPAPELGGVAGAAGVAVEEILAAAHTADAAVGAVEGLLGDVVVVEGAEGARVGAKGHAAAAAVVPYRLAQGAQSAHDLGDQRAVQLVPQLHVLRCGGGKTGRSH